MTNYLQQHYPSFPKSKSFRYTFIREKRILANRPGELFAIQNGCLCSPKLNKDGYGETVVKEKHFLIREFCPLHDREDRTKILINLKNN